MTTVYHTRLLSLFIFHISKIFNLMIQILFYMFQNIIYLFFKSYTPKERQ